jgi:hypothetical protein
MATRITATIEDLYQVKSKAELVGGEKVYCATPSGQSDDLSARRQSRGRPALPGWVFPVNDLFD